MPKKRGHMHTATRGLEGAVPSWPKKIMQYPNARVLKSGSKRNRIARKTKKLKFIISTTYETAIALTIVIFKACTLYAQRPLPTVSIY